MEENIIRLNSGKAYIDETPGDYPEKTGKIESNIETDDATMYRNMLNDHLELIERQSYRVVHQRLNPQRMTNTTLTIENEALELSTLVIDTLKKDNYHVLRMFKGTSKLSTYITAIIARLAVDMIRKKLGRTREKEGKEGAQKTGTTGTIIPIEPEPGSAVKNGFTIHTDETEEICIVVPDTASNPEEHLISGQQEEKMKELVNTMIEELTGEERLLLRMRFPLENGEKTGKIDRISSMLGISEKAVYKRISRIMEKCRTVAKRKGVNIHDLLS